MQKPVSSKHLEGVSDLTLSAPIRQGFIDAFEAVTYETRLRVLMEALFKVRSTAREHSTIKPFVETTERIQSLLDFRLAIDYNTKPHRLYLSATFDRPFEPYMRLIWDPLGPLLDVIFCNCQGYVKAVGSSFEDYLEWVRSAQIDSNFFYAASAHSIEDVQYLSQIERLQREAKVSDCDAAGAATTVADMEKQAAGIRSHPSTREESNEMAIEALSALYRLADFYPPDKPDGRILRWAVQDLLAGWNSTVLPLPVRQRFADQLEWFETLVKRPEPIPRPTPPFSPKQVQPGILDSHDRPWAPVTHGCLLLMRVKHPGDPAQMANQRRFIGWLERRIWKTKRAWEENPILYNAAFTRSGLAHLGVPPAEMAKLPQEFHEGMEDRAGLIGDVRGSHPRRWNLPKRNWDPSKKPSGIPAGGAPVEMSEIDLVVQLRIHKDYPGHEVVGDPNHPLSAEVTAIHARAEGWDFQILSVQSMRRATLDPISSKNHFGFADGLSQPAVEPEIPEAPRDRVALGEILWGYPNDRHDGPPEPSDYFHDGSFLVVRKMAMDVAGFDRFVEEQAARIPTLSREDLLAKMMGRTRSGAPLLPGTTTQSNDFDYENDREGLHCPFQAHIRRANPRTTAHGRPTPRILRRGLSYGPTYAANPFAERGIFFMAYNASLAEQFEVIQRWINGGNATGVASCQSDPMMGVGQHEDSRTFRFHHGGKLYRVDVPVPFVKLEWGLYLFSPSRDGMRTIAAGPAAEAEPNDGVVEGERIIQELLALAKKPGGRLAAAQAWKVYLEDFGSKDPAELNLAAGIWAAIRKYHEGALRVVYTDSQADPPEVIEATLVASEKLVNAVYLDPDDHYSMKGQRARMVNSFGEIFLGLDRTNRDYEKESKETNDAILAITEKDAFKIAYEAADEYLELMLEIFRRTTKARSGKVDLRREFISPVLAAVCRVWFGIPDEPARRPGLPPSDDSPYYVLEGGWSWEAAAERKPRCPADYMAPSRYCFYPDPVPAVRTYGEEQGKRLRAQLGIYFQAMIKAGKQPAAQLSKVIFNAPAFKGKADRIASTVIGVMTGFLPPADGSLRWTLYDWIKEKSLWRTQHAYVRGVGDPYQRARSALTEPLMQAMQKRPSPDLLWRTVLKKHKIGNVEVYPEERVIIGIVSATNEQMEAGRTNVMPIFGGDRRASPYPTHACPAYRAAMGTMLGMLGALLDKGRIESLPSPLIVKLSDPRPLPPG
jgi:Dyp-type peroxidase family